MHTAEAVAAKAVKTKAGVVIFRINDRFACRRKNGQVRSTAHTLCACRRQSES